eukprot:GEMP01051626.1.p1 GENE.GEMP01051626.1~~GEMP01051626.1.p1  ORF type:complete len:214 (+),score=39.48 GEMP01051626.1:488-1129(+)
MSVATMTDVERQNTSSTIDTEAMPILIKNPDGSISEGLPPGYKETPSPPSPRQLMNGLFADVDGFEVPADELEYLYSRHVRLFLVLVFFEFAIDAVFNILYVYRSPYALAEIGMVYVGASTWILERLFWTVFTVEMAYCIVFYCLVLWATNSHCARRYATFSQVCLGGIVGHVFMAYINKFNLLIFFLRLIAYMYARFLRSLCLNMQLVVPNE